MTEPKMKNGSINGNAIRVDFNGKMELKFSEKRTSLTQHKKTDKNRIVIFSISLLLHVLILLTVAVVFGLSDNFKSKNKPPEFIEVLNYEEFIPPVEEKIQIVKKLKLEEDAMPDDPNFKETENNVVNANPDGDENAKALSQSEGDNGTIDYMPQNKIDEAPVLPSADIRSKVVYPPLANKQGIEGNVVLELYIDKAGVIRKIIVLKDPGYGFAEAALKAMEGIRCTPAMANGSPVAVRFRYPFRFTLSK
jgi:protein TonB